MATIIEVTDNKYDCIATYVAASLDHVRMVEHKLTEVLEKLEETSNK